MIWNQYLTYIILHYTQNINTKNQIEELKTELQATKSAVNQGSEKKIESLSNVSVKKNIESVEIE